MKKIIMLLTAYSLSLTPCFSQGTWTSRTSLPDSTRDGAVGFSIGNYGYMGLGQAPSKVPHPDYKDFWQFNPSTNSWTRKANFPGKARGFAATFVIGNYGYVVTGIDSNVITCTNECWQYNVITNVWTKKANYPGLPRDGGVGFSIGKKGYVGLGSNDSYDSYKDFWAYDTATNAWTQIADFGGIPRLTANGFSMNGTGYVCFGEDSTYTFHRDIWVYDTGTNTWTQKSICPDTSSYSGNGFVIGKDIYVGTGQDSTAACLSEFWQYNTTNNTWTKQANFPDLRGACSAFAIGDTGYMGLGAFLDTSISNYFNDLYRFLPDSIAGISNLNITSRPSVYPNPFNIYTNIEIPNASTKDLMVTCYDLFGREQDVQFDVVNENNGIDVKIFRSKLANSTYIIRVYYDNKEATVKIIVN